MGEVRKFWVGRQYLCLLYTSFTTAPGAPAVKGQDNVKITASKDRGTLTNIEKCTVSTIFGVGGAADRVFLSGNPDKVGFDWYSGYEDPTFWPDTDVYKRQEIPCQRERTV